MIWKNSGRYCLPHFTDDKPRGSAKLLHISEYGHSYHNTSVRMQGNLVPNNLFSLENRLCLKTTVCDLYVKALLCVSEESSQTGIISCLLFLCRTVRKLDEKNYSLLYQRLFHCITVRRAR